MGGTTDGGKKTAAKLLAQDPDYYKKIRAKVKKPVAGRLASGSFDKDPERARIAGAKGGRKSKRGPAKRQERDEVRDAETSAPAPSVNEDHTGEDR